jgi:hypothetical protein
VLPGTNRAADRFARASFYISAIPEGESPDITLAGVQRHPQCFRSLWDYDSRPAQYFLDPLAHGLRPEEKDLLLRIRTNPQYLLGPFQGRRFLERNGQSNEAGSGPQSGPHPRRKRGEGFQGHATISLPGAITTPTGTIPPVSVLSRWAVP